MNCAVLTCYFSYPGFQIRATCPQDVCDDGSVLEFSIYNVQIFIPNTANWTYIAVSKLETGKKII